ncbi:abscission/NoCut checkpoint regulator-like [Tetranychus urticae]|uniref:Uncharacterized protein n=1 Tax=Tetranychus urticae TaxID=32264 RepID=T1JX45_TETUR|nr:abscission/NoCut checkpoint regulator-like [Tetranychus urticae]
MDDKELEERLARLRGLPASRKSDPPITVIINKQASKTETEQSDELLKRMMAEAVLDQTHRQSRLTKQKSTDEEIADRLARLRGISNPVSNIPIVEDPPQLDSDEESDLLVEKIMSETKLPDLSRLPSTLGISSQDQKPSEPNSDEEELPWCTLCNEDAVIRCYGCENDLFCRSCFKQFHRDSDMKGHKTVGFSKKKNSDD